MSKSQVTRVIVSESGGAKVFFDTYPFQKVDFSLFDNI